MPSVAAAANSGGSAITGTSNEYLSMTDGPAVILFCLFDIGQRLSLVRAGRIFL